MNNTNKESCPFCKQFDRFKQIEADCVQIRNSQSGKATAVYKVALIHELYYNGFCCGSAAYQTEELKYCPVCGDKIRKDGDDG